MVIASRYLIRVNVKNDPFIHKDHPGSLTLAPKDERLQHLTQQTAFQFSTVRKLISRSQMTFLKHGFKQSGYVLEPHLSS